MNKINWKYSISVVALGLLVLTFKPILPATEKNCLIAKGVVADIYEGGYKDAVLELKDDERTYYVNRGLLRGLDLLRLKEELINQNVSLKYPRYWTPLDPMGAVKQISKIELGDKIVFNEMK